MIQNITNIYKTAVDAFLTASNDKITVNFLAVVTGSNVKYDAHFGESTNSTDVDDIGLTPAVPAPQIVYGKIHLDTAGLSLSGSEEDANLPIGKFKNSDAVFTCAASGVLIDTDDTGKGTIFDKADYIEVDEDQKKYKVIGTVPSGLGRMVYINVMLRRTNE